MTPRQILARRRWLQQQQQQQRAAAGGATGGGPPTPPPRKPPGGGSNGFDFAGLIDNLLGADPIKHFEGRLGQWEAGGYGGMTKAGPGLANTARFGLGAARFLPYVPVAMGAIEGSENGLGGAVIEGGSALAGAALGSMLMPGFGTALGAGAGQLFGSVVRGAADRALSDYQAGVDNPGTHLAAALEPVFRSSQQVAEEDALKQANDPQMLAIRQEQRRRMMEAESSAYRQQLLQQAAMAGGMN